MSRARELSRLGNPNIITADSAGNVGFGSLIPTEKVNVVGVVSATQFFGDGSGLEGIASAGIGTALSDDKTKALNTIYFTNDEVTVTNNSTVNPPETGYIAYTQAPTVVVEDTKELIVSDGDDLLVDVLGIATGTNVDYAARGNGVFGNIYVDNIESSGGQTSVNFPKGLVSTGVATFHSDVSIGGTLTYEDVKNIDSVGLITARSGIDVTAGTINASGDGVNAASNLILKSGGNEKVRVTSGGFLGIGAGAATNKPLHIYQTTTDSEIRLQTNSGTEQNSYVTLRHATGDLDLYTVAAGTNMKFHTVNGERLRIGSAGQIGLSGANYGSSGQVLTSQGASAAPQWASIAAASQWTKIHSFSGAVSANSQFYEIFTDFASHTQYKHWQLRFRCESNSNDFSGLGLQMKFDGSYKTSGYRYQSFYCESTNEIAGNDGNADRLNFVKDGKWIEGVVDFYDPNNTTRYKLFSWIGTVVTYNWEGNGDEPFIARSSGGWKGDTTGKGALQGLRFKQGATSTFPTMDFGLFVSNNW